MSRAVVLALDQGSSSSRVLAFGSGGRALASAQRSVKTYHPRAGWIEHDALDLARTLERCLDDVLAKLPKNAAIAGAGLASQRSTIVFWDRQTGEPAARAPSWQDGRAAAVVAPLQGAQGQAHEATGLYLTPYYSAPKIRWCLDNDAGLRRLLAADRLLVGPVSTWVIWRLTQGKVFAVDPTMAQRMMLLNIRTLDWDDGMLSLFAIPRRILPEIRPTMGDWGSLARRGRTFPLLACVGDQQAAVVGLGARAPGSSVANYGTGAFFLHNTGPEQRRIPGLLTSVAWKLGDRPADYLQEGTVHAAGTSYDWLRMNLRLLKDNKEVDALCRASKQRVLALPAIGGLGAPRWDYTTKTAFFGLTSQTRPADIVRGVTEGIAFLISDIVSTMRAAGVAPQSARVSGGLSRISYLMQFQADVLGLPLSRCAQGEATALGAASLAAEQAGVPWAADLASPRVDKVFEPRAAPEVSQLLRTQWQAFVSAQAALSREIKPS